MENELQSLGTKTLLAFGEAENWSSSIGTEMVIALGSERGTVFKRPNCRPRLAPRRRSLDTRGLGVEPG